MGWRDAPLAEDPGQPAWASAPLAEEKQKKPKPGMLDDPLRTVGLAGKAAAQGVAALPLVFADLMDLPKFAASIAMSEPYEAPSKRVHKAFDKITDTPRTPEERLMIDAVSGGTAAFSGGGPAKVLTALSGAAGGIGGGMAREAGADPVSQIVAAIAAGLTPAGIASALKTGGRIIDASMIPGGGQRSAVRATANIIPDKDAVADAMLKAKPGQDAGHAAVGAGNAEFSALYEVAKKNKPTAFQAVEDAAQAERAATIGSIAKTPKDLEAAKRLRDDTANVKYRKAYSNAINADPALAKLAQNPFFKAEVPAALELAVARGVDPKKNLTEFLHFVKEGLDKQLKKTGNDALTATQNKTIGEVKDGLVAWLAKKNPDYEKARATYAKQSDPINKMVAGAVLEKALTSSVGREKAATFTNAVDEVTRVPELQRKSGALRFKQLDDILDPAEMAKVRNVANELKDDVRLGDLSSAGSYKVTDLYRGEMTPITISNFLSRPVMIANAIIRRLEGSGTQRTTDALSKLMMPDSVKMYAELVKKHGKDDARQMVIDAVTAASWGNIPAVQRSQQ